MSFQFLDPNPTTEYYFDDARVQEEIEAALTAEQQTQEPLGFWQTEVLERISSVTLKPVLRTNFDRKFARDIINSTIFFTGGLVASTFNDNSLTDMLPVPGLFDPNIGMLPDFLAALAMGYGAKNMHYILHQHAHVRLTTNEAVNKVLDVGISVQTGFMTAFHWAEQHIFGHHKQKEKSKAGELSIQHQNVDRRKEEAFVYLFMEHDIPSALKVWMLPVVRAVKNITEGKLKDEVEISENEEDKVKLLLRQSGAPAELIDNLVFDEKVEVNYVKGLIEVVGVWAAIAAICTINPFLLGYYAAIQVFTHCTDAINHTKPDGSGYSPGMINTNQKLAKQVPGFTWHRLHHAFESFHPEIYGVLTKHFWETGRIGNDQFENCPVQPGADERVLVKTIGKVVARNLLRVVGAYKAPTA